METVQFNLSYNLNEETSPEQLLPPDSPDISDLFGNPQICPRIGDEYQVEIPPMITGSEHLRLLMDPIDSEDTPYLAHSFLLGLPIPVTWSHRQNIDFEEELSGDPSKPDDGAKVDKSIKSSECKKGQNSKRKKISELSAKHFYAGLEDEKESNTEKFECGIAGKTKLSPPGKSSCMIPGLSGDTWSNAEVDGFLLGLYTFGKDFGQIKRLIQSKEMGDILSFYYGAFYRSDRYCRWSDDQKRSRRKNVYGRKIFTGWRQQELLSRLLTCASDELKNNVLEVSKSFVEGRVSLESYVCYLKNTFGISTLVEAIGIGKGKSDLTSLAMQPPKNCQISPELPSGKACSALTSGDIIKFLTGGFRLSKARCNDIFWEAVWPRLLARGWHSEQPKNKCSVSSKHYLVFLMPGVKKFSRRKLVKGSHYFDSVSDVLSKVASEPTLIELDAEGRGIRSCGEENGWVQGELSDPDDPPNHKPLYLKPRVSVFSSNNFQFTVIDSSLIHGGKASKMRELRYSPIDLRFTSKRIQETQDSRQVNATCVLSKGDKYVTDDHHREKINASSNACRIKFTIVDTSLLQGGNASQVRGLRYLPVKLEIFSEIKNSSGGSEDDSSDSSSCESDLKLADRLSGHSSVDAKPSTETVTMDNLLKNNDESKYYNQSSSLNPKNSGIADQSLDEKPNTSEETGSNRIIRYRFSRRDKSTEPVKRRKEIFKKMTKRRKLTAHADAELSQQNDNFCDLSINLSSWMKRQKLASFAKTETTHLTENISSNPINSVSPMKRQRFNACANKEQSHLTENSSADISEQPGNWHKLKFHGDDSGDVPHSSCFQDKVSSISSPAKGNPESVGTPCGSSEKLQLQSSNSSNPLQFPLKAQNGEPGIVEADSSQCFIGNSQTDLSKTTTDVCGEEQQRTVSPRRQSRRSRPSTTRVLEAFECGFFSMKKAQTVKDVQAQSIPFSSPSRKARSRVKTTSKHTSAAGTHVEAKEVADGTRVCSKDILNKPPALTQ